MANVAITKQDFSWKQGAHWCFSQFVYNVSGDTVIVPTGTISAGVFGDSGTAPTATITAVSTGDSVALTSGTVGKTYTLITKHAGNPASVR
jgi:hypothetical protein